jgi:hypothetical protein
LLTIVRDSPLINACRVIFLTLPETQLHHNRALKKLKAYAHRPVNFFTKCPEIWSMTVQQLDYIFPFGIFLYGVLMVFVHENPWAQKLNIATKMHIGTRWAWICFFVGGLWSLQNLWV